MADEKTPQEYQALTDAKNKDAEASENHATTSQLMAAATEKAVGAVKILTETLKTNAQGLALLSSAEEARQKHMERANQAHQNTARLLKSNAGEFSIFANSVLGVSGALVNYSENLDNVKNSSIGFSSAFKTLSESASNISILGMAGKELVGIFSKIGITPERIQNTLQGVDTINRLKESMLQSAAASGTASEAYDILIKGGIAGSASYINNLYDGFKDITNATGVSTEAVAKMHNALRSLSPALINGQNALNAFGAEAVGSAKPMDFTTAALKIAEGSFSSYGQVISDTATAINNYNASGPAALAFTAKMAEMTTRLGVPISDARDYMTQFSGAMKFVGDNMEGSAETFARLYEGFRQTGVSSKAAADMVKDFTGGINNLNIQQKAFLSAQTGGPGGLRGGFEIEKMLQEGKYVEVFEKVKKTMQKMLGGNLVSLDEATKSEAAASQYQKQIMMLKSGPLGQFAQTDAEARKMLEGFSKGFGADMLKSRTQAAQEAISRGEAIQAPKISTFTANMAELESMKIKGALESHELVVNKLTLGSDIDSEEKQRLRNLITQSGTAASEKLAMGVGQVAERGRGLMTIQSETASKEFIEPNTRKFKSFGISEELQTKRIDSIFDSISSTSNALGGFSKEIKEVGNAIRQISEETVNYVKEKFSAETYSMLISSAKSSGAQGIEVDSIRRALSGQAATSADAVMSDKKQKQEQERTSATTVGVTQQAQQPQTIIVQTMCKECNMKIAADQMGNHTHAYPGPK